MSGPPKCRVCEKHHWPRDPHSFGRDPAPTPAPKPSCPRCVSLQADVARLTAEVERLAALIPKPKRDRRTYQRDLMRDRRAAAKAAAPAAGPKSDVPT